MHDIMQQHAPMTASANAGWYGAASGQVARFLTQLRCISAVEWLRVTEAFEPPTAADVPELSFERLAEEQANVTARHRLCEALGGMPQVVRRIRERISDDIAVFRGIIPERQLLRMQRAAHLAAFALAAHHRLSRDDVRRLYRPFEELLPAPRGLTAG